MIVTNWDRRVKTSSDFAIIELHFQLKKKNSYSTQVVKHSITSESGKIWDNIDQAADDKGGSFLLQDWDGDASLAQTTFRVDLPVYFVYLTRLTVCEGLGVRLH